MCDFWHDRVYMDLKWSAEEQKKKQFIKYYLFTTGLYNKKKSALSDVGH